MDLDWLRTFLVAAEEENFHRTAVRLHLAQPTVTMHIQKLEFELGVRLFERLGRSVRLSGAGRRFWRHANQLVHAVEVSREDLLRWQQGYEETIRVAVSPLVATTYLPHFIRAFTKTHPNVSFSIQVMESKDIANSVAAQSSDVGLSRLYDTHPRTKIVPLYEDPLVLVAPSDGPDLLERPQPSLDELIQEYTVLTHNHPEYWDRLSADLQRRFPRIRTMQVSQVHVTVHLITEKMGISFLPTTTVRRELLRGTMMEIPCPELELPLARTYLVTPVKMEDTLLQFVDCMTNYMSQRPIVIQTGFDRGE